ncbi:MAG: hypothetical protein WCX64_02830 [Candidatus Micrarchaeia archaeon]|jgi:hypothetical protein
MPLEGKYYHDTELLKGEHPLFGRHSAKIPLLHDVRTALTEARMPASKVSVVKAAGRNNPCLRIYLKETPGDISELPKAVEAIGSVLKAHNIDHVHNGWSPVKQ